MKNKRLQKFLNRTVAFVTAAGLALLPPGGALTGTGGIETVLADDAPAGYHYEYKACNQYHNVRYLHSGIKYFGCCENDHPEIDRSQLCWWENTDVYGYYCPTLNRDVETGYIGTSVGGLCYFGHGHGTADGGQTGGSVYCTASGNVLVPNNYTVTFNPANGQGAFTHTVTYDSGNWNSGAASASKTGYKLLGWYTGENGTGEKVYDADGNAVDGTYWSGTGSSAVWKSLSDLTVYAAWKADTATQTIYFYRDGAKDDAKTKTYSASIGSTFDAESHKGDSTFEHCHFVKIDKSSWKVTGAASTNVYYETDKLSVSYNGNGATSGSVSGTSTPYGGTAAIAGNGFSRTGYTFTGWNTASDGSGTAYSKGQTFTAQPSAGGQTLTLYAQWKINSHSVKINKGTGISSTSGAGSYNYGSSVTVSAVPDTGYTWSRWTGTYESSARNHSFTMPDKDVVLTANAVPKTYTMTFNAEGGSLTGGGSCTVTFNDSACSDVSGTLPARTGYAFLGWYTAASGGVRVYDENGKYVQGSYWTADGKWIYDGSLNVYAHWILVSPPVVGASPSGTSVYSRNVDVTITAKAEDIVALAGSNSYQYCLSAGADAPSGSWTTYTNGMEFTMGNGLTGTYYLWIKHVKDSVGNESASSPNASYHRFGPYYFDNTAPDLSTVSTSYGWYASGTVIDFDIPDPHSGISSIVLTDFYGIVPESGDITSDRKFYFGTEGVSFYTITASDSAGNTALKSFIVKIDKKGEVIPDNSVWKWLGDVTVFAHWMPNTYTVRFDKNDNDGGSPASGSMPDLKLTYDAAAPLTKNGFSRDGYTFAGWNTSPDGTGKSYTDGEPVKNLTVLPGEVITLYAVWEDTCIPVISVTPSHSVNPDVGNDAVKSIDVTITITEKGSGFSSSNKYEYAITTSNSSIPSDGEWKTYCDSAGAGKYTISSDISDLGKGLTGQYYLWIRQAYDNKQNISVVDPTNDGYIGVRNNCHVFGIYNFDNTAPTGEVGYVEDFDGYFEEYQKGNLNAELYSYLTVYNGIDNENGSGVNRFFARIANKDNLSEYVDITLAYQSANMYSARFNLYKLFGDKSKSIGKYVIVVYGEDKLGNICRLKVATTDFGDNTDNDDVGFDPIDIENPQDTIEEDFTEPPVINDQTEKDASHFYERDAFRIDAKLYDVNGKYKSEEIYLTGGAYAKLLIFTFGNVESVSTVFDQNMKNTLNATIDNALDMYDLGTSQYTVEMNEILCKEEYCGIESGVNKLIDVRAVWSKLTWRKSATENAGNESKLYDVNVLVPSVAGSLTTHEFFIPWYASGNNSEITYGNNIVCAFKNGKVQLKKVKIELSKGRSLDDLRTQILGENSK